MTRRPQTLRLLTGWLAWGLVSSFATPLSAQISPGELSEAHGALEGSSQCLTCHRARRGIDPAACLSCHEVLRQRLSQGSGLHASNEYSDCKTCHIEHQGRDFELVWWGEEGIAAFDHATTGHRLVGSHAGLDCRACHRERHVRDAQRLLAAGKSLDRTFLGLDDSCAACHDDVHREQFTTDTCDRCHGQDTFSPAIGFSHDRTSFPLRGRHRSVTCAECHPPLGGSATPASDRPRVPPGNGDLLFRGIDHGSCTACHRDPHGGRLGTDCESCHGPSDWSAVEMEGTRHETTRFPLRGRHREVTCDRCHGAGLSLPRPDFSSCRSCHSDRHLGQFDGRPGGNDCAFCHDVDGFRPARYTREDHRSSYPLEGAHSEADCRACHTEVAASEVAPSSIVGEIPSSTRTLRFRFTSHSCVQCHDGGHGETVAPAPATDTCVACHDTSSWWSVAFSHRETGYPLEGGHRGVECRACHGGPSEAVEAGAALHFGTLSTECGQCHRDSHAGQFVSADGTLRCERCHDGARWSPVHFDHETASRFSLRGAHLSVRCSECHPSELRAGVSVVVYRPLPTECASCHAAAPERKVPS